MKWFKHETDAHTNLKLQMLIRRIGLEGYGYFWFLVELAGKEENFRVISGKSWKKFAEVMLLVEAKKQDKYLEVIADLGLIDKKAIKSGTLYIPKLGERSDDYTKRVRRVYEHTPNIVPLEQKRTDKNRIEQTAAQALNKIRTQLKGKIKGF